MDANVHSMALGMLEEYTEKINCELKKGCEEGSRTCAILYEAQRYSLLAGGKRIRPALVLEVCRMCGGDAEAAMPFALAVEYVHTYSLIHDDLPSMDNDDMRRGKPSNHKVFGEAYAILAGDGLLSDAFGLCAGNDRVSAECARDAARILSEASGSYGMVRGQAIDMFGEDHELSLEELLELHTGKTGAMIRVSVMLGALAAGVEINDSKMQDLVEFADKIGLVFQIVDDVLDVTSSAEVLGKNTGADAENGKTTFLSFYTVEGAMQYAQKCTNSAISCIEKHPGSERLCALAQYLCQRQN